MEASSGEEAVELVRQVQPSLVLIDMRMPGMCGCDAARMILSEHPKTRLLAMASFEEVFLAQEALEAGAAGFVLKPIRPAKLIAALNRLKAELEEAERLRQAVRQTEERLQNLLAGAEAHLLEELLRGSISGGQIASQLLKSIGKQISAPAVLLVHSDQSLYPQLEPNGLLEALGACGLSTEVCLAARLDEQTLAALISTAPLLEDLIECLGSRLLRALGARLFEHSGRDPSGRSALSLGLSRPRQDLALLPEAHAVARRALSRSRYLEGDTLMMEAGGEQDEQAFPEYPFDLEERLLEALAQRDLLGVEDCLAEMARLLLPAAEPPEAQLRSRLAELLGLASRAVIQPGAQTTPVLETSHAMAQKLERLQTRSEYQEWLHGLAALSEQPESSEYNQRLVSHALEYIDQHKFRASLKFNEIAQTVHISSSHLAYLLKARLGVNYLKYLTGLRMKEAKKLLRGTSLTAAEIAQSVGFEDHRYFHRVFRRETGMTPIAFRQQGREDSQDENIQSS